MSHGLEEKEAGQQRDLHQHHRISGYNIKKSNDVQDTNRVENNISRSSQGLFQKGQHGGCQDEDTTTSEGRYVLPIIMQA